ncbi:hypothetical protein [Mycobacterium sp. PSTR-4-N]|uniref:hypothetical protein n=1 Tax=Mycobacterium sp. PSTR-4-N TaxID=2917745 RepID=UPI001F14B863|nr:hypothetical protein [Mycobacterium sp. PSTR-4-N]MCG7596305.1 hypothetical protein [Mycobacterium sp. PSTR-4-N]
MKRDAFMDTRKWWIFRSDDAECWNVSSPAGIPGQQYTETNFPTGAEALAAFARGAA